MIKLRRYEKGTREKILRIACHSALRLVGQEPEPSQATVMALACCFLGKDLELGCLYFPPPLDIPTFAARYLQGWNCGREYCPVNLAEMTTSPPFWDQSTTWDRRLYFTSEGRRAEDFFSP